MRRNLINNKIEDYRQCPLHPMLLNRAEDDGKDAQQNVVFSPQATI